MPINLPKLVIPQYITIDNDIQEEFLPIPDLPEGIFKPSDKEGENLNIKYQNMHLPIPQVEFLDNGSGSPQLDENGDFHPYQGAQCKLRVTNHEEIVALGIKYVYNIGADILSLDPDGTITWKERINHSIFWHEISRPLEFIFYVDEIAKTYTERVIQVFPQKPQIYYENTDGSTGIKLGLTSFANLFKFNSHIKKVTVLNTNNVSDWSSMCYVARNLVEFNVECDTSNVTNLNSAWIDCSSLTSFPYMNTSNVTDMAYAWVSCSLLTSFPAIDTSKVTDISYAWYRGHSLTSFPAIDTSKVTNMANTWAGCSLLTSFPAIDTSNVTNLANTWQDCSSLTSFPAIDTSKVTNMSFTWYNCNNLTSFLPIDTSNVTNMVYSWYNCSNLTSFPSLDTSNVTDMSFAWSGCSSLTSFPSIDTSKVIGMRYAWNNCKNLTSFPAINTGNVTNMASTWYNCSTLTSFPAINTDNVTDMTYTWSACTALDSFGGVSDCSASDRTTWESTNLNPKPCGQ